MIDPTKPFVEVVLDDGEQQIEAHNFHGKGCKQAVDDIQRILGGEVAGSYDKPEMYASKPAVVNTVARQ